MTPIIFYHNSSAMHDFSIASTYYCKGEVFFELKYSGVKFFA